MISEKKRFHIYAKRSHIHVQRSANNIDWKAHGCDFFLFKVLGSCISFLVSHAHIE